MSQPESTTPPLSAKEPFDNLDADVILRSSDNVDFRVFKAILSLTSPVFKAMFTLPQPDHAVISSSPQSPVSLPVVPVSESAATLETLLLLCYPAANPPFKSFRNACDVVDAATKYDMTAVLQRAKELFAARYLESEPLSFYALCCCYGWEDLAQRAARETLKIEGLGRPSWYVEEMENMTAAAYHRLLQYHWDCGTALKDVGKHQRWILRDSSTKLCGCGHQVSMHSWFRQYLSDIGEELRLTPCLFTLFDPESPSRKKALHSGFVDARCRPTMFGDIDTLRQLYATEIEEVMNENVSERSQGSWI